MRLRSGTLFVCGILLTGAPLPLLADDDLGVTMRMVTDDEQLTESVVREIELRDPVRLKPSENSAREARERGREFGQSASERAREMRELRGNGGRPDMSDIPGTTEMPEVPPRPERPEVPGQGQR